MAASGYPYWCPAVHHSTIVASRLTCVPSDRHSMTSSPGDYIRWWRHTSQRLSPNNPSQADACLNVRKTSFSRNFDRITGFTVRISTRRRRSRGQRQNVYRLSLWPDLVYRCTVRRADNGGTHVSKCIPIWHCRRFDKYLIIVFFKSSFILFFVCIQTYAYCCQFLDWRRRRLQYWTGETTRFLCCLLCVYLLVLVHALFVCFLVDSLFSGRRDMVKCVTCFYIIYIYIIYIYI